MTKLKAGRTADLPPGALKEVQLNGKTFAIANFEGTLYAMDGICGHTGGRLGQGQLIGDVVKCPRHGSEYDVRTGKNVKKPYLPFAKAADRKTFTISIEGEDVVLDI